MRSPSSISSFSPARSAVFWVVLILAAIELRVARMPASRWSFNVVDDALARLDAPSPAPDRPLWLGDSVANQLARELNRGRRTPSGQDFTANAAIEAPGQYLLLRRHLDHHPPPPRVVLMSQFPDTGKLTNPYVENHVTRCFLRWREIGALAWQKRDAAFGLRMTLYKLLPTLRHRADLQTHVPYFFRPDSASAHMVAMTGGPKGNSLTELMDFLLRRRTQDEHVATRYFVRMVADLDARRIPLHYIPTPRAGEVATPATRPLAEVDPELHRRLAGLAARYPSFTFEASVRLYPRDWFGDGTHFKPARLAAVARDLAPAFGAEPAP